MYPPSDLAYSVLLCKGDISICSSQDEYMKLPVLVVTHMKGYDMPDRLTYLHIHPLFHFIVRNNYGCLMISCDVFNVVRDVEASRPGLVPAVTPPNAFP